MTSPTLYVLSTTAIGVGLLHTVIGVDHTIPFIAMARARGWNLRRTLGLTALCGAGHVLSSVAIAVIGILAGMAVDDLSIVDSMRGELAAWALIVFGCTYAAWGWARRNRPHTHGAEAESWALGKWGLFVAFVLGPCEPMVPLLIVPGLESGWGAALFVAGVFSVATVAAMLGVVTLGYYGLRAFRGDLHFHHADVLAGFAIAASGVAIKVLEI